MMLHWIKYFFWQIQNLIVKLDFFQLFNYNLVILDDAFPNKKSLFRYIEYKYLLDNIPKSIVYSTGDAYPLLDKTSNFKNDLQTLGLRVEKFRFRRRIKSKLVYCNFLHLTCFFLEYIELNDLPFVFTLYPGGSFKLNDQITINNLNEITSSKNFRKVIVTQKITYDLLVNYTNCPINKIQFIYGVVTKEVESLNEKYISKSDNKLNCCFISNLYTTNGLDKGYDVFLKCAKELSSYPKFQFNVIGHGYDYNLAEFEHIKYLGPLDMEELDEALSKMDVVISYNRPNILAKGSFDGFPTGGVIQGALNGCLMLVNDPLDQNVYFENNKDIVICNDSTKFTSILVELNDHPDRLKFISENGRKKSMEIFGEEFQLKSRIELIRNLIEYAE